jgi:3-oxoacid CoA-transferase B subunit
MADRAGWPTADMAARVAADIPDGAYVNLGIGLPNLVAEHVPTDREVMYHSENGILGMGPRPPAGEEDPDLIAADKQPCTLVPGAAIFDTALSFAIIRGGRLDLAIMGGLQVSATGDLANWRVPAADPGGVGGAMDLAAGVGTVWILMTHTDKAGRPKIVERCTFPHTATGCVRRIYTNLAVIDVSPDGLVVTELAPGVSADEVRAATGPDLRFAAGVEAAQPG